jgi:hypothetical protein
MRTASEISGKYYEYFFVALPETFLGRGDFKYLTPCLNLCLEPKHAPRARLEPGPLDRTEIPTPPLVDEYDSGVNGRCAGRKQAEWP